MSAPVPSMITTGLVVAAVVFPLLSLAALYGRWKAKRNAEQKFTADDAVIIPAWISAFSVSIVIWIFASLIGLDTINSTPVAAISNSLKASYFAGLLAQIPLTLVKLSILLFYRRIFSTRAFHVAAWVAIGVVTVWGLLCFFLQLLLCGAPHNCWAVPARPRINTLQFAQARVISSLLLDVMVLCLPLPVIWTLHMKPQRKLAVMFIFWIGIICIIAAGIRIYVVKDALDETLRSPGLGSIAVQWRNNLLIIVELHVSIVAACLPYYGPLLRNGRKPESIIRSVRSILSLNSQGSGGSRGRKSAGTVELTSREHSMEDGAIELQTSSVKGAHNFANVQGDYPHSEPGDVQHQNGINVTRGVHVTSQ